MRNLRAKIKWFYVPLLAVVALSTAVLAADAPGERWLEKAKQPGISAQRRTAYLQLATFHLAKFQQLNQFGSLDFPMAENQSTKCVYVLYKMGMDPVPYLAEALEDDTPTPTATSPHGRKPERVWKVSDIAALVLRHVTRRDFAIGEWPKDTRLSEVGQHPEMGKQFKEIVLSWYGKSGKKSLAERQIEDVESDILQNRLGAIKWIGEQKLRAGQAALIKRIDEILGGKEVNTSLDTELAECSLALGRIGDKGGLDAVSRACKHISYWYYMTHRPLEEGRAGGDSGMADRLFDVYWGYALLGHKEDAIAELKRLQTAYSQAMEPWEREKFAKRLELAAAW